MCFDIYWVAHLLIVLVVLCLLWAIVKAVVPFIMKKFGVPIGEGAQLTLTILGWIVWAIIACAVIWFFADLLVCLWHGGFNLFPSHR